MRLKKRIALAAALALLAAVLPLGSMKASAADYSFVRVKLSTPNTKSVTMSVKGAYFVKEADRLFTDGTLTVSASGGTVSISHSAEGALYSGGTVTIERVNLSRDAGYLRFATSCGTRMYLGHFSITASGGLLSIVNRVPMTHYLYGVVGHEMSDSFPLEALKAQAVTARCYALRSIRSSGSYDLLDTSENQVYKGYTSTYYNVIAAVDAVADVALYYNNDIMICYYSASNGGYMLKPSSVWSGASPYDGAYTEGPDAYDMKNPASPRELVAIPSAFFPNTVKPALYNLLYGKLVAAATAPGAMPGGYSFSALLSIDDVVSTQANGSASGVSHTKATVRATVIATIDHIPATPAPLPTATPSPTPTAAPTASPTATPEITPTPDPSAPPDASASPDSAETPTPAPTATPTETPTPAPTAAPTATPVPLTVNVPVTFSFEFAEIAALNLYQNASLRVMYAVKTDAGFALQRCRYGHGVGMSQRGAEQMALEGKTYQEILAYYYGGSRLGTMAAVSPESGPSATSTPSLPGTQATGAVTGEAVVLRKNPTTSSEQLAKLALGTKIVLTGLFGDWYQVSVPDKSLAGYCHGKYITPAGDGVIARGYVNAAAVNYRSGPGTSYGSLGKLSKSTQLGIYGLTDGWYRVLVPDTGKSGYVSQSYVTITDKAAGGGAFATPTPTPAAATPTPAGSAPTPTIAPTATPTPTPMPTPAGPYTADGSINAAGVNIRKGASTSTQSFGKLDKGEKLGVYEKVGSWYSVKVLSTGKTGYVYAKYVTIASSGGGALSTASAGTVNASAVNIRKGPSASYASIGRLNKNTKVSVLASEGSWYKVFVSSAGATGYVFGKYVTLSSTSAGAARQGVVTALLNLRTAPTVDSSSRVLATMERGDVVTVHSTANGWCFVTYNGTTGYCIASCVEVG